MRGGESMRQAAMVAIVLLLVMAAVGARADSVEAVWGAGDIDLALCTSRQIAGGEEWAIYGDVMYSPGSGRFAAGASGAYRPIGETRLGVGVSTRPGVFLYLVRGVTF
jgi:hypothetical protein